MAQRTRKEIIAEIMNWSATWGSPLSREQAEAKADQTIKAMRKATRPRWGWFISLYDHRGALGACVAIPRRIGLIDRDPRNGHPSSAGLRSDPNGSAS
jgi:hypothetical protein